MMGHCKDCIRWYKNAPDYGLGVTEWICDRSHPADGSCTQFIEVSENENRLRTYGRRECHNTC